MNEDNELYLNQLERTEAMSQVAVLDLGEGNVGGLGADALSEEYQDFHKAYDDPEFRIQGLSDVYVCMDGRFRAENASQVLGGIAILDTYTDLMIRKHNPNHPAEKISNIVAKNTKQAISDGFEVTVHGDTHKKKDGCVANFAMEDVLRFNAQNIDVIAPLTWRVAQGLGLDTYVQPEDVTRLILNGKANADIDLDAEPGEEFWDVNAEERANIIVANGGTYIELEGVHGEIDYDLEMEADSKVDTVKFGKAFPREDGDPAQLFVVTLGKYAKDTFKRAESNGRTKQQAAETILAAITVHIAASKVLGNKYMGATLSGKPYVHADQ